MTWMIEATSQFEIPRHIPALKRLAPSGVEALPRCFRHVNTSAPRNDGTGNAQADARGRACSAVSERPESGTSIQQ